MKFFTLILLMLNAPFALGAYPTPRSIATELDTSPFGQRVKLGLQIEDKTDHILRGLWDFSVQGGGAGTFNLIDLDGKKAVLPPGAILTGCVILVDAAVTIQGGGSAQISFSTGDLLQDVKPSASYTTFNTNDGLVTCQITPTSLKKLPGNYTKEYTPGYTSAYTPTISLSGSKILTGKIRLFLDYIISR